MNILEINTLDTKGGAAKVAYSLKTEMNKLGHKVSMYVKIKTSSDPEVYVIGKSNILSRWLKKITGKDIGGYFDRKIHEILATDIDLYNSDSILESKEFKEADIIHCHNLHGDYFKLSTLQKIAKIKPLVWTFHDMWPITPHCAHAYSCPIKDGFFECPSLNEYKGISWHNESYLRNKKRRIYENSNFSVVVPCLWLKDKVKQTVLRNKELSVIYNGIDTSVFIRSDKILSRQELDLPVDKKIVLFLSIGKNTSFKGWKYVLDIASHYKDDPNTIFLCIGGAKNYESSTALANIKYVDFVNSEEILAKYYSASDVFLSASLAETFPLTILEAMSCGLPVVSFDVGGVKEAIEHRKNGYLAKYSDGEDLLQGVKYILSMNEKQSIKMSSDSKNKILDNFSKEKMIREYISLFDKCIQDFSLIKK
jgi:glycosyltransferase involved in cell wall biosynthesis